MNARVRSLLGPSMVGLGVWCALGELTLATPDSTHVRLAAPASFLWLPVLILVAVLVPGWRRRPALASPALLATVPWWPVPLPAIALVWTGHATWVPIGLAVTAALLTPSWEAANRATAPELGATGRPVRSAVALAGSLTLLASLTTAWLLSPRLPGGDEPHYLVITQSLLKDGDLRIANNHEQRDYADYFGGTLAPDVIQKGRDNTVYSIHAPGTSVLVLPAFALFGYRGAQAAIVLLAGITGALMWYAAWLAVRDRRAAWFAWLAIVSAPTFLIQSVTIFPDGPGSLVVAACLVVLLRMREAASAAGPTPRDAMSLVGASALLAALPWLHTRFVVLAAGFGLLLAWQVLTDPRRTPGERAKRVAVFLLVPAASAVAWFAFFQLLYGTPNPTAPYGASADTRIAYIPGGMLGLLLDQQFGLLMYSPVLAAALAGCLIRNQGRYDRLILGTAFVTVAYLAAVATYWMWWAGVPATPARFAAAVLPVLAVPLAVAWQRSRPAVRAIWQLLLILSVGTTVLLVGASRGALAWNVRGPRAAWLDALGSVVDLARGWPSFFWRLTPGDVRTEAQFALHVAAWVAVFAVSALGLVVLSRRASTQRRSEPLAAVGWLALALMAAIASGWWLNGVRGTHATRSQLALLDAAASGRAIVELAPFSIRSVSDARKVMQIRLARSDPDDGSGARWTPLEEVPAGIYTVRVTERRPRGGQVTFRIGRSPEPIRTFILDAVSNQTVTLPLPGGAAVLAIDPDTVLASAAEHIELIPTTLAPRVERKATVSARFGEADVYFFDDAVFVESDGFWVRGARTTELIVSVSETHQALTLELANGASANAVAIEVGGVPQTVRLNPSESRIFRSPVPNDRYVRLRISSPSGFRPSDAGSSRDARYLGVRVRVID